MKIAILSDIHDHLENLKKFLTWSRENSVARLFICGDLTAPAIIKKTLGPHFDQPIDIVYGNVADREGEREACQQFDQIIHHGDLAEFEVDNKKVALIHYPDKARELAVTNNYDLVCYGHTHLAQIEKVNETQLINPGSLAGLYTKFASFAVWNTVDNKIEIIKL